MPEPEPRFSRDEVIEMLAAGPRRIASATAGVPADAALRVSDGPR